MALVYSGISVELREVVLKNKPSELIRISAKGTVPVLLLYNGVMIDESLEIMQWCLDKKDPDQWKITVEEQSLIDENDRVFKKDLDGYKYPESNQEHPREYYRNRGDKFLHHLDKRIAKQGFLISSQITLADIAIFPFVRQFAHVDKQWFYQTPYPDLQTWLDTFLQSELFSKTMKKYKPWKPENHAVLFPEIQSINSCCPF